jgi:hypothetical protein
MCWCGCGQWANLVGLVGGDARERELDVPPVSLTHPPAALGDRLTHRSEHISRKVSCLHRAIPSSQVASTIFRSRSGSTCHAALQPGQGLNLSSSAPPFPPSIVCDSAKLRAKRRVSRLRRSLAVTTVRPRRSPSSLPTITPGLEQLCLPPTLSFFSLFLSSRPLSVPFVCTARARHPPLATPVLVLK